MKLSQLVAASALFVSTFGASVKRETDDPEIKIQFYKFDNDHCHAPGDDKDIAHGECKNFDYKFGSFLYQPHYSFLPGNDDDWTDSRCSVIIYEKADCEGQSQCMGSFAETSGYCGQMQGFLGSSARVDCQNTCAEADVFGG